MQKPFNLNLVIKQCNILSSFPYNYFKLFYVCRSRLSTLETVPQIGNSVDVDDPEIVPSETIPEIENSLDVDDPEIVPVVIPLASPSRLQVPLNPIVVNSSGISSLPQVRPAFTSLISPLISESSSNSVLDSSLGISSLPQAALTTESSVSISSESSNYTLESSSKSNSFLQITPSFPSLITPSSGLQVPFSNPVSDRSEISSLPKTASSLANSLSQEGISLLDNSPKNSALLTVAPVITSFALQSPELQNTSDLVLDSSRGYCSVKQKKRYYREEWKIVPNDKKATEDRLSNLVIDAEDPWGMWCESCTKFAAELGSKYVTNFVKNSLNLKPPRPKRETVNIHFTSIAHAKCSEKAKVNKEPAT